MCVTVGGGVVIVTVVVEVVSVVVSGSGGADVSVEVVGVVGVAVERVETVGRVREDDRVPLAELFPPPHDASTTPASASTTPAVAALHGGVIRPAVPRRPPTARGRAAASSGIP